MSDYVQEPLICQSQVKFRAFCRYMLRQGNMRGNLLAGEDIDRIAKWRTETYKLREQLG